MHLHYRQYGSGPVLILLHGLFGSLNNWHSHALAFAGRFTVFAVDQRNHGASSHDPVSSYPAMAEDLREFMDLHGIDEAFLLGHSMGGKTVMQFAGKYPERARALVVVDIAPRKYPPRHEEILNALMAVDPRDFATREEIDHAMAPIIQKQAVRRFLATNLVRDAEGRFAWRMNVPVLIASY
ncbi:MAG TPA: alpha/beta fold hydrolase, partial [Bacteroidota bacterium]|nr:alpha/beta fold hydrolase [Bacteroidota bacterium]